MKKLINDPHEVEKDLAEGLVAANKNIITRLPDSTIYLRTQKKKERVALVSGGGSGHEPAHGGYVGHGMLDAAVMGNIYSAPPPNKILTAIKEVATSAGVLCIITNYTGDVLNFEIAIEQAEMAGIEVASVLVADDVASYKDNATGRRGLAGVVLIEKIAGAMAETGCSLDSVKAVADRANAGLRTMGLALNPCYMPVSGEPCFVLGDDEIEFGLGLHGEPGASREKMQSADKITRKMLDAIMSDYDYSGREVIVMVNGLGATPSMELYIINKTIAAYLEEHNVRVYDTMIGNFMTSMEMSGFSISLLKVDTQLKALYDMPALTAALKK